MLPTEPAPAIRKRMRRREGGVRFITFSCQGRLPLLSNPRIADLFLDRLAAARARLSIELFAYVVMPEHVHLLVRSPRDQPLDRALLWLKLAVAQRVIRRWRESAPSMLKRIDDGHGSPRFWQKGGGFDRNVRDLSEFSREVRYIHHNPVERGLVTAPRLWKWSSVRWWGQRENEVECDPPPMSHEVDWSTWKGYV
jgi:putative transposase